jgi:DNA polymerase-3 subunit delta'
MTAAEGSAHAPVLDRVKGQPGVLGLLRGALRAPLHTYLFIGPPGSGRLDASIAFAAALLCSRGGCGECASCQETLALRHPDLEVVERVGASISVKQAREVARMALRTPRAAPYQVLVLVDFHLVDEAAPALLKTIEEPPDTTVIIITAETVPSPFVTIASRCVQVQFKPLDDEAIIEVLMGEGVEVATATAVAEAAGGRLDRARLLARDPGFAQRLQRWRTVPSRLDGTGARVAELADELLASIAEPLEVVRTRQAEELALLQEQAERRGENNIPGRSIIEDRHNRELRRVRTDEIRAGLAALSSVCRARLTEPGVAPQRLRSTLAAIAAIDEASTRLSRNVNATMLLQWLLLHLDT